MQQVAHVIDLTFSDIHRDEQRNPSTAGWRQIMCRSREIKGERVLMSLFHRSDQKATILARGKKNMRSATSCTSLTCFLLRRYSKRHVSKWKDRSSDMTQLHLCLIPRFSLSLWRFQICNGHLCFTWASVRIHGGWHFHLIKKKWSKLRWIDRYIALISVIYISILYIYVIYVFWLRIVVSLTTTRDIESYAKKEKTGWYLVVPSIDRFFDVDSSPAIADSKEESDSSNKNIEFQFIQENENGNI